MGLFLRRHERSKNGKDHTYWSLAESSRCPNGKVTQRQVLYLGDLNQAQQQAWAVVAHRIDPHNQGSDSTPPPDQLSLFDSSLPSTSPPPSLPKINFSAFSLHNPRQWGACWIASRLWHDLKCDEFWEPRLPASREGTRWRNILQTLVTYRLIDPGSEFRLHREWFGQSAMADLLGEEFSLASKDNLYRCLDRLLPHREALFEHLQDRWRDLFGAKFDLVLYDLTSTYFECDPPDNPCDKRQFGYSRDKRSDCVQVVVGLIVTPEGFPMAYEVLAGNTTDKSTLKHFLKKIRRMYGKARRTWIMDRGIPTEEVLKLMRKERHQISYLVGTPKGQLSRLEKSLVERPWKQARANVAVKLLPQDGELYVYVESQNRVAKERSMRRRKLRELLDRLKELREQKGLKRDALILKLGQAKQKAGRVFGLVEVTVPEKPEGGHGASLSFRLLRSKLREVRRREGRYLLRTNLKGEDPVRLWENYLQLVEIEEAFKNLKSDLSVRPVYHSKESRIEAHIFVAFMAYCLQVCLKGHLKKVAGGLTPRAVLEKFQTMQMVEVHLPIDGGGELVLTRRTQPNQDQRVVLEGLGWELPDQPPPRITAEGTLEAPPMKSL